ncbi:hypothetical protein GCM10027521_29240 [Amycolatopsis cihanbeyliensis]
MGGGGFQGIIADFGQLPVAHWTGGACEAGPPRGGTPRAASRFTEPVPAGVLWEWEVLAGERDAEQYEVLTCPPRS